MKKAKDNAAYKKPDIIYRAGTTTEEKQKAVEQAEEDYLKSYSSHGGLVGFMLGVAVIKLFGLELGVLWSGLMCGFFAGLGSVIAHLEFSYRRKKALAKQEEIIEREKIKR